MARNKERIPSKKPEENLNMKQHLKKHKIGVHIQLFLLDCKFCRYYCFQRFEELRTLPLILKQFLRLTSEDFTY